MFFHVRISNYVDMHADSSYAAIDKSCCILYANKLSRYPWSTRYCCTHDTLAQISLKQSRKNYSLKWRARVQESKYIPIPPFSVAISLMCAHTGRYGFVIAVTTIDNIGFGALQPGRGFALYPVKYKVRRWCSCLSS